MAHSAGLPVAPVRACFHRSQHISEAMGRHLRTREEVATFLRDPSIYPMFSKPVFSQQGYGSAYRSGYDPATDSLNVLDRESISVDAFLRVLDQSVDARYRRPECGYVFQEPLAPAREILQFIDWEAICGVRIICLNGSDGSKPVRAMWKVATPPNHVDNFSLGKRGNLLADIDLVSGEVSRMIGALWPRTDVFSKHPISGQSVSGFRLLGWSQLLETCRRAGAAFPLMKIHHWVFALTDKGPLILELNECSGPLMGQRALGQ